VKKIIDSANKEFGKGEVWAIVCVFILAAGLTLFPVLRTLADEIRGLTNYSDTTGKSAKISATAAVNAETIGKLNADRLNVGQISHSTIADTGVKTHAQLDTVADTVDTDSAAWTAKQAALSSGPGSYPILNGAVIRSVVPGTNITVTVAGDSIRFDATGGGGEGMTSEQVAQLATTVDHLDSTTDAHGGIVPSSRTVNGQALTSDITITAGLLPDSFHAGTGMGVLTAADSVTFYATGGGGGAPVNASDVVTDTLRRFVSDADTARWNGASLPTVTASDSDAILIGFYSTSGSDTMWSTNFNSTWSNTRYTLRHIVPASALSSNASQVRIKVSGSSDLTVSHASIGEHTSGGQTSATPTELKFGEASGFASLTGVLRSDWLTFSIDKTKSYVIILDYVSGTLSQATSGSGATVWASTDNGGESWNSASSGGVELSGYSYILAAVEIQSDVTAEWVTGPKWTDFIPLSYLDTDTMMEADSDSKIATQKAVKAALKALEDRIKTLEDR
jgi:hypothetical protein